MMTNLFSIFDPISIMNLSLNWLSSLILIMLIPLNFTYTNSRLMKIWLTIMNFLINEFKIIILNYKFILIPLSIFILIMTNNLFTLIPYIFTSTSHLQLNLLMTIPIWLSIMFFGWMFNMNQMFYHLVPKNTPSYLMMFMVLIETISNLIRPMTLSIRLTANLIAGHLLLSLLSSIKFQLNFNMMWLLILTQMMLILLEMSVAIIQAYVFSLLICLYFMESN